MSPRSGATRPEPVSPPPVEETTQPRVERPNPVREWLAPSILFAATLLSTLIVGGMWAGEPYDAFDLPTLLAHPDRLSAQLLAGIPFAASLLGILLAHEFGHYIAARRHKVDSSPPWFLPFPSLLGTLGAVIRMRGTIPHRAALVDIAAAGPLAGFVVALPLALLGLSLSHIGPVPNGELTPASLVDIVDAIWHAQDPLPVTGFFLEGSSLLHAGLIYLVHGPIPAGHDVYLHPVALAAWFGLFVTALNLVPVGQLDGGHVLYAVWKRRARLIGRLCVVALTLLGLFAWAGWMLWAVLAAFVIRTSHPPTDDDTQPLSPLRQVVCWLCLALFALTFVPIPLRQM